MTTRVICLGNTTLDKVWPVFDLPSGGGKTRASDYFEVGGGMGANAAVAVARLGGSAAYWGRAGDDAAGETMKNELRSLGVDVSHFRLFAGARSSTSAILVDNHGERAIINFRGAGIPDDPAWLPVDAVAEADAALADIRWIDGARALFGRARECAVPTVLDAETAMPAAFAATLPLADHAVFSEPGLRSFAGNAELDTDDARVAALRDARALGCRVAAITRGHEGVLWVDERGVHRQPAFKVKVVDTTGAGDVFHGAYAFALGEGQDVADAMRFAAAAAALKCTRQGGRDGIPGRAETQAFMALRKAAG